MTHPRKNIQRKAKINAKMVRSANKSVIKNGFAKDKIIKKVSGITPFFTGLKAFKKSIKES